MYKGRSLAARVVDAGDAQVEVDPGDWAIVKVKEPIDLPALQREPRLRLRLRRPDLPARQRLFEGHHPRRPATSASGRRNNLVTCLTDGHPGVSGGGVLNRDGELVGIPIGRMQGDYRFSFILPLRAEMFRKVK